MNVKRPKRIFWDFLERLDGVDQGTTTYIGSCLVGNLAESRTSSQCGTCGLFERLFLLRGQTTTVAKRVHDRTRNQNVSRFIYAQLQANLLIIVK